MKSNVFVSAARLPTIMAIVVVVATLLSACGISPAPGDSFASRDAVSNAIEAAELATGLDFQQEAMRERELGDGDVALAFEASNAVGVLTVIRRGETAAWTVRYFEGSDEVVVHHTGEVERTATNRVPEVQTLDRCQYCAEKVWHEPYWVENWVTRTVKRAISASTALACSAAGGSWTGVACFLVVEELVDEGYWTSGYWECLEWRYFEDDLCITD